MNKYLATGWFKYTEEDVFATGCIVKSSIDGGHDTFTGATVDELIAQCAKFAGTDDLSNCLLDSCDEAGRLDVQVYENASGSPASAKELADWKEGKERLWLATYTFQLLQCSKVVLSRNVVDPKKYAA